MSFFKSQDGHILCRVKLEWTKYRVVISCSGYIIIIIIIIMFNHQYLKRCVQSEVVYRDDTCTIQKVKHKHNGYKQEQGCGVHADTVQLHI